MCIFLLAAGLSLLQGDNVAPSARVGPVVLFVYLFTICYSLGEGPTAFLYSSEVFPTIHREQGMAWAVCINNTFGKLSNQTSYAAFTNITAAGVLSLTFPRMRTVMTTTGAFGFYAGLNLIAWFMIFAFVREVKQLTLEEISDVFAVPTKKFLNYELTVWLPWFIKRYVLFQKIPKPAPLVHKKDSVDEVSSPNII
jgi:hypothetical protein